jgi:hypothetical protein
LQAARKDRDAVTRCHREQRSHPHPSTSCRAMYEAIHRARPSGVRLALETRV